MNIHEYQARQLLAQNGVVVPAGEVCASAEAAQQAAEQILDRGHKRIVVKAQIHAGGRGKGTFKSGFQGGVKICQTAGEVYENARAMLGNVLVTKQTGPDGRLVSKVLVVAAPEIRKEFYCAVLLDRADRAPDGHGQHGRRDGHRGSRGPAPEEDPQGKQWTHPWA